MKNFCYQKRANRIHRLDALPKLAWSFSAVVLALLIGNPLHLLLIFLATFWVSMLAGVFPQWSAFIKFAIWISMSMVLLNLLIAPYGESTFYVSDFDLPLYGQVKLTYESLFLGISMSIRLTTLISIFALLSFTIPPEGIFATLARLRFPYKSVFMVSLATRFIPLLSQDLERISVAQSSRGLDLDGGSLVQRLRKRLPILVPLVSNSLERSVEVSEALEARAFGSSQRTFYKSSLMPYKNTLILLSVSPLLFLFPVCLGWANQSHGGAMSSLQLASLPLLLFLLTLMWFFVVIKDDKHRTTLIPV
ncbi:MAG: energy-coupling factor transporter transmembrane protein EcfT [Candidatus Altiarchaeota archaeon]|nr:energy-coupling factor transporter transmembrane protein EcfT [Candidatus Altiarchaeota archaeon]